MLNNYLVPEGAAVPDSCEPPAEGELPQCSTNEIRAWAVQKESMPADGEPVHVNGKVYYRVKITSISGDEWSDVSITDDLTGVLSRATWETQPGPTERVTPRSLHPQVGS